MLGEDVGVSAFAWFLAFGLFFVVCATTVPPWSKGLRRNLLISAVVSVVAGLGFLAVERLLN
jgi:hypothetical protein